MPINVLDLSRVAPGDQCHIHAEGRGQALPLLRTGSVLAVDNRLEDFSIQGRGLEQLLHAHVPVCHPIGHTLDALHVINPFLSPEGLPSKGLPSLAASFCERGRYPLQDSVRARRSSRLNGADREVIFCCDPCGAD